MEAGIRLGWEGGWEKRRIPFFFHIFRKAVLRINAVEKPTNPDLTMDMSAADHFLQFFQKIFLVSKSLQFL